MYQLELDRYQSHAVVAALDAFARIHMGQVNIVTELLSEGVYSSEQIEKVRGLCDEIKQALGFTHSSSFGIHNEKVPQVAKASWDIVCVLRQVMAKAEDHGQYSVWHQEPLHCDSETPLAKCKFIGDQPDLDMGIQNIDFG
jgi:3-deoxy-D-arabino-heptulosonate 7-phosphate (DAHP) synthase class II